MKLTIRKAVPEDAGAFTDCGISCWQSAYKGIVPDEFLSHMSATRAQRVEKHVQDLTNPGNCVYYCVMYDERMVGLLIINKSRNDDAPDIGEIWAIYLVEEFCGKGYGKELLDFQIGELKGLGCKEIYLWVFEENLRARRFYEKHGFSFTGVTREVSKYGKPLIQIEYVLNH